MPELYPDLRLNPELNPEWALSEKPNSDSRSYPNLYSRSDPNPDPRLDINPSPNSSGFASVAGAVGVERECEGAMSLGRGRVRTLRLL